MQWLPFFWLFDSDSHAIRDLHICARRLFSAQSCSIVSCCLKAISTFNKRRLMFWLSSGSSLPDQPGSISARRKSLLPLEAHESQWTLQKRKKGNALMWISDYTECHLPVAAPTASLEKNERYHHPDTSTLQHSGESLKWTGLNCRTHFALLSFKRFLIWNLSCLIVSCCCESCLSLTAS